MRVLLTFIFVIFFLSLRATRRGRQSSIWPVLVGSVLLTVALLGRRFI